MHIWIDFSSVFNENQYVVVVKKDLLLSLAKSLSYHVVLGNLLGQRSLVSRIRTTTGKRFSFKIFRL